MSKHEAMMQRIQQHGERLLAIFHGAKDTNAVRLCKKLRRLEVACSHYATQYCNGDIGPERWEANQKAILLDVYELLSDSQRVWINGDPRGYALKIDLREGEQLHRDMGGYGIIAPDLTEDN